MEMYSFSVELGSVFLRQSIVVNLGLPMPINNATTREKVDTVQVTEL
jgi:hypothetical protein